jgi:integrase
MASKLQKKNKKWTFRYKQGGKQKRYICQSLDKNEAKREQIEFLATLVSPKNKRDAREWAWVQAKADFIEYVTLHRSSSHKYNQVLSELANFLNVGIVGDITTAGVSRFIDEKLKSGIKQSTVNRYIDTISAFFSWLKTAAGYVETENPTKAIKRFKTKLVVKTKVLSPEEVSLIFKSLDDNRFNFTPERVVIFRTIFYLALYAGLRLKEIKLLKREHILFDKNSIIVEPQKIAGVRPDIAVIPLHSELKVYLLELFKSTPKEKYAVPFIENDRRQKDTPYYSNLIVSFLKRLKIKDTSIHTCRHTFISLLANSGVDSADILKYARIGSLKVLEVYRHITAEKHQENINIISYK